MTRITIAWLYVAVIEWRARVIIWWCLSLWPYAIELSLGTLFADDQSAPAVPGIKEKTENGPREDELLGKNPALHDGTW